MAAAVPLERARDLEPDKSSIREALGRAYFRSAQFDKAAEEFAEVVERYPVNDYAHFCLGRASRRPAARPRRAATRHSPRTCAPTARTTRPSRTASRRPSAAPLRRGTNGDSGRRATRDELRI